MKPPLPRKLSLWYSPLSRYWYQEGTPVGAPTSTLHGPSGRRGHPASDLGRPSAPARQGSDCGVAAGRMLGAGPGCPPRSGPVLKTSLPTSPCPPPFPSLTTAPAILGRHQEAIAPTDQAAEPAEPWLPSFSLEGEWR